MEKGFYWARLSAILLKSDILPMAKAGAGLSRAIAYLYSPWISNRRYTGLSARGSNRRIPDPNSISSTLFEVEHLSATGQIYRYALL